MIKIKKIVCLKYEYFQINDRYEFWNHGVIYDNLKGGDIPEWIFIFRDCIDNYKSLKEKNQDFVIEYLKWKEENESKR